MGINLNRPRCQPADGYGATSRRPLDILEGAACAVAIDSPAGLASALLHIERNFEAMSEAAGWLFSQREFERYEAGLAEFIADPARASLDPRDFLPITYDDFIPN